MKFRNWLENEEDPEATIELDPNRTMTFMPDDEFTWGPATIRNFNNVLSVLRKIDSSIPDPYDSAAQPEIRNPNGSVDSGFAGTVDFASPEQTRVQSGPSLDNYERVLQNNIPNLFPHLAREAKELAALWARFRNKVISKAAVQENARPLRPIFYALPLQELKSVMAVLQELGRVIRSSSDAETKSLAPEYVELYKRHMGLLNKVEPVLQQQLAMARQNPFG